MWWGCDKWNWCAKGRSPLIWARPQTHLSFLGKHAQRWFKVKKHLETGGGWLWPYGTQHRWGGKQFRQGHQRRYWTEHHSNWHLISRPISSQESATCSHAMEGAFVDSAAISQRVANGFVVFHKPLSTGLAFLDFAHLKIFLFKRKDRKTIMREINPNFFPFCVSPTRINSISYLSTHLLTSQKFSDRKTHNNNKKNNKCVSEVV